MWLIVLYCKRNTKEKYTCLLPAAHYCMSVSFLNILILYILGFSPWSRCKYNPAG